MLKTEQNTPKMCERVLWAAAYILDLDTPARLQADFEHGQWWITHLDTGAQYSVCDAEGYVDCLDGFILEQVTEGSED